MTPHQLITAPWEERNKLEVAKCWPEVQKFYGLPDLPHGALYAGTGSKPSEMFKGHLLTKINSHGDKEWSSCAPRKGDVTTCHYCKPYRDILDPPSGSWEKWEERPFESGTLSKGDYFLDPDDLTWEYCENDQYSNTIVIRRKPAEPIPAERVREFLERLRRGVDDWWRETTPGACITHKALLRVLQKAIDAPGFEQFASIFEE